MRLAFFHNLPSGGALRAFYAKAAAMEKRGHVVSLYTLEGSESDFLRRPAVRGSCRVEPLRFKGLSAFRNYFQATRRAAEVLNGSDADFAYVDKCRIFGSPPLLRYLRKPHALYCHEPLGLKEYDLMADGTPDLPGELWAGYRRLKFSQKVSKVLGLYRRARIKGEDSKSLRSAQKVMAPSEFAAQWIRRVYGTEAVVNYQGVDTDFFSPDGTLERVRQLLAVGRMERRKAHDFTVRVVAELPDILTVKLVIVCDARDPEYESEVEGLARSRGVRVQIEHRPSQERLKALYQSSRLVLCAGVHEPFGLVPLEAMACGTPVLAVDEGGFRETVVDGETGFLLPRDARAWAQKLTACFSDRTGLEAMGRRGRDTVLSRWTWDLFADRLEKIIGEVQCQRSR